MTGPNPDMAQPTDDEVPKNIKEAGLKYLSATARARLADHMIHLADKMKLFGVEDMPLVLGDLTINQVTKEEPKTAPSAPEPHVSSQAEAAPQQGSEASRGTWKSRLARGAAVLLAGAALGSGGTAVYNYVTSDDQPPEQGTVIQKEEVFSYNNIGLDVERGGALDVQGQDDGGQD